tara:strand:- start:8324 stop:8638 length:315 start_codon:yes stop_codon:yes gene_type:complete
MKKINIILITLLLLYSCASFKEAGKVLRNEKIKTTDEFLIKKKEPLVLPPDYSKIPKPGSLSEANNNEKESDKIKRIMRTSNEKNINKNKSSSVEESIINRIRK